MISKRNARATGAWLAASAAVVFASGCSPAGEGDPAVAKVQCDGANACKGQSECQTAHSDCTGMNSCKGKGWISLTAEECEQAGGSVKG